MALCSDICAQLPAFARICAQMRASARKCGQLRANALHRANMTSEKLRFPTTLVILKHPSAPRCEQVRGGFGTDSMNP